MRGLLLLLVVTLSVGAFGSPARAQDAASAFPQFCESWMEKLVQREEHNVTHIHWQQNGGGVTGSYIGYTRQHTCTTKNGTHSTPVGKITYEEIKYEKRGPTPAEAELAPAQVVGTSKITEIFRYSEGRWIY
jgi:hypothetical protein